MPEGIPLREYPKEVRYLKYESLARIVGATPEYAAMNSLDVAKGEIKHAIDQRRTPD